MNSVLRLEIILAGISDLEPWQIVLACQDQPEKRFVPTDCAIFNDKTKYLSVQPGAEILRIAPGISQKINVFKNLRR